ncbi:MAG: hypothetical protein BM556_02965 [Bacteriovorax sp. MedPE-SWde]|nr:MAG: hypothetical protein BM556_02965 [Bacteriovorax sp. MedPE-SWde]
MEEHPLFAALNAEKNPLLKKKKNDLLKMCKERDIPGEYDDDIEDLAFLVHRYDINAEMTAGEIEEAFTKLGINPGENKNNNLLILVTYELALVDLIDADEDEITELCQEYKISKDGKELEALVVELAVSMVNQ